MLDYDPEQEDAKKYIKNANIEIAETYYIDGVEYYKKNNISAASKKFKYALKYFPEHRKAAAHLNEIEKRIQDINTIKAEEYNNEALKEYSNGNLNIAIGLWKKALKLDSGLDDARISLQRAMEELK